jgi:DNA polymerase-4
MRHCIQLFGSVETIGQRIKDDIKSETDLVASVGIAENKFLAKLASDLDKPDGFVVITPENMRATLDPLDIRRIWGIGKVTAKSLHNAGIQTVQQLRKTVPSALKRILGNQAEHILALANGIDNRPVESDTQAKSISSEQTFATDIADKETLLSILLTQLEEVAQRLRTEGLQGRTVTLKIRYGNFKTLTRSVTLDQPTDITQTLWQQAKKLFLKWHKASGGALRLLGVGVSGLSAEGSGQGMLFEDPQDKKQKNLDSAFDEVRKKYGDGSLKRGH